MTTGTLLTGAIVPASAGINAFLDDPVDLVVWPPTSGVFPGYLSTGTLTDNLPISEIPNALAGEHLHGFGSMDWYDRIHWSPAAIECGNIITPQTQTISIWNAWRTERTLSAVALNDVDGIAYTPPGALPYVYEPLKEANVTLSVSNTGAPQLDGTVTLDFLGVPDIVLPITGSRIVAWTFRPDWSGGILERLEWKTDVITAYDGSEQRIALRQLPRRSFEFDYWLEDGRVRRNFEALLWSWGALVWAVPVWTDGASLSATLPAGSTSVPIDTNFLDYEAGGIAIIMTGPLDFEILTVDTVNANSLALARVTERQWPAGALVFPARVGYIEEQNKVTRFTGDTARGTVRFRLTDDSDHAAASETTYRSYPVLAQAPVWTRDITLDFIQKLTAVDFGVGGFIYENEGSMPATVQSHHWTLTTKAEIDAFRAFLYSRKGRAKGLWVPTFTPDLIPTASVSGTATTMDVEHCNYTLHHAMSPNRRDIRIELRDGSVYYRRITSATEIDANTERLGLDTPTGTNIALDDVVRISFMAFARLDGDAVELAWSHDDLVDVTANWRAVKNGV